MKIGELAFHGVPVPKHQAKFDGFSNLFDPFDHRSRVVADLREPM
jgi:hypothetical protein